MQLYKITIEFNRLLDIQEKKELIENYRGNFHDAKWREIQSIQERETAVVYVIGCIPQPNSLRDVAKSAIAKIIGEGEEIMKEYLVTVTSIEWLNRPVAFTPDGEQLALSYIGKEKIVAWLEDHGGE